MDETRFIEFTENLPWEVFRMKGPVRFKDNTRLINFVGGKSEWIDWEDIGETRLAFVGMGVNPDSVLDALKLCVADS
jgi:G3E family GTPase